MGVRVVQWRCNAVSSPGFNHSALNICFLVGASLASVRNGRLPSCSLRRDEMRQESLEVRRSHGHDSLLTGLLTYGASLHRGASAGTVACCQATTFLFDSLSDPGPFARALHHLPMIKHSRVSPPIYEIGKTWQPSIPRPPQPDRGTSVSRSSRCDGTAPGLETLTVTSRPSLPCTHSATFFRPSWLDALT